MGFYFGSDIQEAARVARQFSHYILLGVGVVLLGLTLRWLQRKRGAPSGPPLPDPERD